MKSAELNELLATLEARFEQNMSRHRKVKWAAVEARLERSPAALKAVRAMEDTGGEPDVIGDDTSGQVTFCDCAAESPAGRRSLCYDGKALKERKENKPKGSAMELAAKIGVELLTEQEYRELQQLGDFDMKTSSWILTPADVRSLGGALFCDRRYGTVFVYHNGAQSYYAGRGFRGRVRV
ncbi:MAG: DUF4256 domain-containing protein [Gemmatimonadaceae bacterium]|nr:DUF4256 domain-containing protein [Gemmatimonadaceae bacterium]